MKCNKCGSEWKTDASRSASITVCPFCQEKIVTEKSSDWQFFDNTKELLAFIATEYGNDALFDRKYFSDHTLPSMPHGQKNLVKQAFKCGAIKILQDNLNSDQAHKKIAVKQAVSKLVDTYASAKEAAERVVWEFTNAIGWGMPEPLYGITTQGSGGSVINTQGISTPPINTGLGIEANNLMIRAWQFTEDGDWKDAADYFNKVLDAVPTHAPAFLGLLCVDIRVSNEGELANVKDPGSIANHKYYKRAAAEHAIKVRLDGYIQAVKNRIDADIKETAHRKREQNAFDSACNIMDNAQNPDDYRKAIINFGSIDSNYQDITSKIKVKTAECEKKIAAIEAKFKRKYGLLFDCLRKEGKEQVEEHWKVVATINSDFVFVKLGGIDWRVLAVENNKALLISEKVLETRPYNTEDVDTTWEQCTLRKYLNSDFYKKLGEAKTVIAETRNNNPNNPWYGTSGGNATTDRVFLLSLDELVKYFGDSGDLRNKKRYGWGDSKYVLKTDGYYLHDQYNDERIAKDGRDEACWWWLRSPGGYRYDAAYVDSGGGVDMGGFDTFRESGGVRPALWLNL